MDYSEDDKTVLNFFFTNLDKPIFAVKNFHPEVWALMQARYSRSREGLREGFLALLKEDSENFRKLKEEIEKTQGGIESEHATKKAIQFMERWVLGFGHSSVAEGAVVGLCLEGVSILATKVIEDNRLCSFIEKSTRYVSFDSNSFYIDKDLEDSEYGKDVKELIQYLFNTYIELHEPVLEYVKKAAPCDDKTSIPAWERSCAARRFDAIRYLLPTCTKTSLGWTVNARQLAHGISKLSSHELKEMKEIGIAAREEASKLLPSLLRYAYKNFYLVKTEKDMKKLSKEVIPEYAPKENVTLVRGPKDADDGIVASILYRYREEPFIDVMKLVKKMTPEEKERIFDTYLQSMGEHDHPMRELEHAQFSFDIIIDYGAFRDLQRHRLCTQTNQLLTSDLGYDIPEDIIRAEVKDKYVKAMEKAKKLYEKLRIKYPVQAQYILPLGFKKRFLLTMNLREIYYLVQLRTIPAAHPSYRKIAYKIYDAMKKNYPLLSKYMVCNYSDEELGRLKAEEKTENLDSVRPL